MIWPDFFSLHLYFELTMYLMARIIFLSLVRHPFLLRIGLHRAEGKITVGTWVTVSEIKHVPQLLPEAETTKLMFG